MEKKREILEELIKQALTSTYKVISNKLNEDNLEGKNFNTKKRAKKPRVFMKNILNKKKSEKKNN